MLRMGYIIQESLYHRQAAIRLSPCIGRSMMKVGILQDLLGVGIYTEGLVNKLDSLGMNGMEHATYCMINVKDHKYIFHNQAEKVATETEGRVSAAVM